MSADLRKGGLKHLAMTSRK